MKKIIILGSTGSLGTQSLEVLEKYTEGFKVIGLAANKSLAELNKQAKKWGVPAENTILAERDGEDAVVNLSKHPDADIVINVLSGVAGIKPTMEALKANKFLLLGNKESLIANGEAVMAIAGNNLIPIDSEHNSIFEVIKKYSDKVPETIYLPCSGGPFIGKKAKDLQETTVKEALAHPTWNMGAKITVESATLLNKGLEVIEAYYLFKTPLESINVFLNPKCHIHGAVKFKDDQAIYGYFSPPDMREHIENGLLHAIGKSAPAELIKEIPSDFVFTPPDLETFKGITIVKKAFADGLGDMEDFLKKEEAVVNEFLDGKIKFLEIYEKL